MILGKLMHLVEQSTLTCKLIREQSKKLRRCVIGQTQVMLVSFQEFGLIEMCFVVDFKRITVHG